MDLPIMSLMYYLNVKNTMLVIIIHCSFLALLTKAPFHGSMIVTKTPTQTYNQSAQSCKSFLPRQTCCKAMNNRNPELIPIMEADAIANWSNFEGSTPPTSTATGQLFGTLNMNNAISFKKTKNEWVTKKQQQQHTSLYTNPTNSKVKLYQLGLLRREWFFYSVR